MWFLINSLTAVALIGTGYGICAYRVVRHQAKEWKKDDD